MPSIFDSGADLEDFLSGGQKKEDQEKLSPPPAKTFLDRLGEASAWWQEQANLKKLAGYTPEWTEEVPLSPRNVVRSLGAAGRVLGAPYAYMGATQDQPEKIFKPDWKAILGGIEAGGSAAETMLTPIDLAGAVPGKLSTIANLADITLGVGDVGAGVKEGDWARAGMGAARVALPATAELAALRAKPSTQAAVAEAQADTQGGKLLPPPTAATAAEGFSGAVETRTPSLEISPKAVDELESLSRVILNRSAAQTGAPVRNVVMLEGDTVTYPDGRQERFAPGQLAGVEGDTIYISREGQANVLMADDVRGTAERLAYLINHEVLHPKIDTGRPTGSVDPMTGQPVEAATLSTAGHAEGGLYDDRLRDLTGMYKEFQLTQDMLKDPELLQLVGAAQERGAFAGAFQGAAGAPSPLRGTYSPELLGLAGELGIIPKANLMDANLGAPFTPPVELSLRGGRDVPPTAELPPPTEALAPPPPAPTARPGEFKGKGAGVSKQSDEVTLYSGGGSSFFSTNPLRAADYGPVREVTVPRAVFEAGRAEARRLGQPTTGDTMLPNEWVKRAVERPDIQPEVFDFTGAGAGAGKQPTNDELAQLIDSLRKRDIGELEQKVTTQQAAEVPKPPQQNVAPSVVRAITAKVERVAPAKELAEFPKLAAALEKRKQGGGYAYKQRGTQEDALALVDELFQGVRSGRLSTGTLRQMGFEPGDLAPLFNQGYVANNKLYGGRSTPKGQANLLKLATIKNAMKRLVGESPSQVAVREGTASEKQQRRVGGQVARTMAPPSRRVRTAMAQEAKQLEVVAAAREGREPVRDLIKLTREQPTSAAGTSSLFKRFKEKLATLTSLKKIEKLTAKDQQAVQDAVANFDRRTGRILGELRPKAKLAASQVKEAAQTEAPTSALAPGEEGPRLRPFKGKGAGVSSKGQLGAITKDAPPEIQRILREDPAARTAYVKDWVLKVLKGTTKVGERGQQAGKKAAPPSRHKPQAPAEVRSPELIAKIIAQQGRRAVVEGPPPTLTGRTAAEQEKFRKVAQPLIKVKEKVRRTAKSGKVLKAKPTLESVANPQLRKVPEAYKTIKSAVTKYVLGENPATIRKRLARESAERQKALKTRLAEAELPKRFKREPSALAGKLEELRAKEAAEAPVKPTEAARVEARTRPLETRDISKKGVKREGSFRAAPKKYRLPKAAETFVKRAQANYPRLAAVQRKQTAKLQLTRLVDFLDKLAKARVYVGDMGKVLDAAELGPDVRFKVEEAWHTAKKADTYPRRMEIFKEGLKEIQAKLGVEAYESFGTAKNPKALLGELAKRGEEGKPSRWTRKSGPWGARIWRKERFREIPDPASETGVFQDPVMSAGKVAEVIRDVFGDTTVDALQVELNVERFMPKGKARPLGQKSTRVKGRVPGDVVDVAERKLYSVAEALYTYAQGRGRMDELLEKFPDLGDQSTWPETAYVLKSHPAPGKGMEYPQARSQAIAGGVPESLNPLLPGKQMTGTAKSSRFRPKADESGYHKPVQGGVRESMIEQLSPEAAKALGYDRPTDVLAKDLDVEARIPGEVEPEIRLDEDLQKARFIREAMEDYRAEFDRKVEQLQSSGGLKSVAYMKKLKESKYDLPEIDEVDLADIEDALAGNRPTVEAYIDPTLSKQREAKWRKRAELDWEEQKAAGADQVKAAKEEAKLNRPEWLKKLSEEVPKAEVPTKLSEEGKKLVDSYTQHIGTLSEAKKRVDQWVTLGKLKRTEAYEATQRLYAKTQNPALMRKPPAKFSGKSAGAGKQVEVPETVDVQHLLEQLRKNKNFARQQGASSERGAKLIENVGETLNFMRPAITAVDVSNPFRQTYQLTMDQITRDILRYLGSKEHGSSSFAQNTIDMLKSFGSGRKSAELTAALEADPWFEAAKRSGVNFINEHNPQEQWIGKQKLDALLTKSKALAPAKWLIDASNRSFTFYQNKVMLDAYKYGMEWFRIQQLTDPKVKISPEDLKTLSLHINNAASRGKLTNDPYFNKLINYGLFSGQMLASRFRMMGSALVPSLKDKALGFGTYATPLSRKYARRQVVRALVGAAAYNGAILASVYAANYALGGPQPTVETDMRSTDFGKIKWGNVIYDGGGGHNQLVRVMAQLITGKQIERGTGREKPRDIGDTVWNFLRSKFAPGPALALNIKEGETWDKDTLNFKEDPYGAAGTLIREAFVPMSVRDINTVMKENPQAWFLIAPMLMGGSLGSDVPASAQGWRTSKELVEKELGARKELSKYQVEMPQLGRQVTLSGRDKFGRPSYYLLSKQEKDEFDKLYMPMVLDKLTQLLESPTYKALPETKRSRWLYNHVHHLNRVYGVATRERGKYLKKQRAGEIEPSNQED